MVVREVAKGALVAALYAAAGRFGLLLDPVGGFATLVWAPTGIALAALLLLGRRAWPAIAVGAFVTNVWAGAALPVAAGIALGNTLEALIGFELLQRAGFRRSLDRLRDVLALI